MKGSQRGILDFSRGLTFPQALLGAGDVTNRPATILQVQTRIVQFLLSEGNTHRGRRDRAPSLEEVGSEAERPLEPSQYPSYIFLTASFAGTCGGADPPSHITVMQMVQGGQGTKFAWLLKWGLSNSSVAI